MRAMGHYPSEQEIDDMVNEVKFSEYVDTGKYISEINLGDFIKCECAKLGFHIHYAMEKYLKGVVAEWIRAPNWGSGAFV